MADDSRMLYSAVEEELAPRKPKPRRTIPPYAEMLSPETTELPNIKPLNGQFRGGKFAGYPTSPLREPTTEAALNQELPAPKAPPSTPTGVSEQPRDSVPASGFNYNDQREAYNALNSQYKNVMRQLTTYGSRLPIGDREALIQSRHDLESRLRPLSAMVNRAAQRTLTPEQSTAARERLIGQFEDAVVGGVGPPTPAQMQRTDSFRDDLAANTGRTDRERAIADERQSLNESLAGRAVTDYVAGRDDARAARDFERQRTAATQETELAQLGAQTAEARAKSANALNQAEQQAANAAIIKRFIPIEAEKRQGELEREQLGENYDAPVFGITDAILKLNGKANTAFDRGTIDRLVQSTADFKKLPPSAQKLAATEILSQLRAQNADLAKEPFQDAFWSWLVTRVIPAGQENTAASQTFINDLLGLLRETARK